MSEYTAYLADEHEAKIYTAWELGADWWWMDSYFVATPRALYTEVNVGPYEGVRLSRVESSGSSIKTVSRYVSYDCSLRLVHKDHARDGYVKSSAVQA